MSCRIVRLSARQAGSSSIPTSRSSAVIGAARSPKARRKERRKRVKSPTASVFCRTCARPFRRNSAGWSGHPFAPCCPRTSTTSAARCQQPMGQARHSRASLPRRNGEPALAAIDLRPGACTPQGRQNVGRHRATDGFRLPHDRQVAPRRHASQRSVSTPKTSAPRSFEDYLSRRWTEGCVRGRRLFQEITARSYTGSLSHLQRLLALWRNPKRAAERPALPAPGAQPADPATGRTISPIVAAALCVKPRGLLTSTQAAKVDTLKSEWPDFAAMRQLAMRFRGIVRSKDAGKLDLAEGCAALRALRDAAVRPYIAQRHQCCEERDHGALEQRPNGRTDQPSENSQTSDVWSSRPRTSTRAHVALVGAPATESEAEPVNGSVPSQRIS
jgi:hypothetical protein